MIKKFLSKIAILSVVCASVVAAVPISAEAAWKQDSTGWWYENNDGTYPENTWKNINGRWYFFDYTGYMRHDTIVDGYYLASDGALAEGSREIQAYAKEAKKLNDAVDSGSDSNAYLFYNCRLQDIDNDGIVEALVSTGTCMMDLTVTVLDYNTDSNTVVKYNTPFTSHAYVLGYDKSKNEFALESASWGYVLGTSYRLENNNLTEVNKWSAEPSDGGGMDSYVYKINGKNVTKQQLDNFRSAYK